MRKIHPAKPLSIAALLLLATALPACRSALSLDVTGAYQPLPLSAPDFGPYQQTPKPRIGSLPFPGALTLFETADPRRLGTHAYDQQTGEPEQIRGILYTCHGGFIDLAHTRKTIDLCKYSAVRYAFALQNTWSAFRIKSIEPTTFVVRIKYPYFWNDLSPEQKERLMTELSIRSAQRLAMVMVTWHEIITWFGYNSTLIVSEKQSAFSYDDSGSHALGVLVGGRALRDQSQNWDQAVTHALNDALTELHVVTPDQAIIAARAVEGRWWSGSETLKRHLEFGWNNQPIEAFTVRDLPFCPDSTPHRFELPRMDNVLGRDCSDMFRIEVLPNIMQGSDISAVLPGRPEILDVDTHFPLLLNHIKSQTPASAIRPY